MREPFRPATSTRRFHPSRRSAHASAAYFEDIPQALHGIDLNNAGEPAIFASLKSFYTGQPFAAAWG